MKIITIKQYDGCGFWSLRPIPTDTIAKVSKTEPLAYAAGQCGLITLVNGEVIITEETEEQINGKIR